MANLSCRFCHQGFESAEEGYGLCPVCGAAYIAGEISLDVARVELVALVHGEYCDPTEPEFRQLEMQVSYDEQPVVFGWDPSEEIDTETAAIALSVSRRQVWRLIRQGQLHGKWSQPANGRSSRGRERLVTRSSIQEYRQK